jgi:GT2 family glycosyltransferase
MAVPDLDLAAVRRTLESVRRQQGSRWSLTMVTHEDHVSDLRATVKGSTSFRDRPRIQVIGGGGQCAARDLLGIGIEAGRALPRALIFPGDVWAQDAVTRLAAVLTPRSVVYGDEDQLFADGSYGGVRLKPEFSPEFLLSSAYVGRPLAMGAEVADHLPRLEAGGSTALEHECALAATEIADVVTHIPEVLCHRSDGSEKRQEPVTIDHITAALRRRREEAIVIAGPSLQCSHVDRTVGYDVSVSILIPFRDEPRLLRTCVDSVAATTGEHEHVEFILIDNGSTDPETLTLMERLAEGPDIRVLSDPRPFNWAALNNAGAAVASGDVLLFLNNDIEARRKGWLSALYAQALRPGIAAAGARLLYPDGRLQHCGLVVGLTGAAGHVLGGLDETEPGYLGMATVARECSAVTGACLATRSDVFTLLGGFDETLGVDLNDVDYCLRAGAEGLRTIYEPSAELIHHESPSRGTAGGVGDLVQFLDRWKGYIAEGDPYLNRHLTRADPSCGLARPGEEDEWNRWYATLMAQ